MPSAIASSGQKPAPDAPSAAVKTPSADPSLSSLLVELRAAQAESLAHPASLPALEAFRAVRRKACEQVLQLPRRTTDSAAVKEVREVIRQISASGINDAAAAPEDLAAATAAAAQGWPGLLAGMLLVPGWQWESAPALEKVPDWLWGDFTAWLFTAPQGFCAAGQAEAYARVILGRMQELVTWVDRNPGSASVRAALDAYLQAASGIPLYFSSQSLKEHAQLRARLFLRALGKKGDDYDPPLTPREGRPLRIGFVNRHFGPQTETYTTLPTFEKLDPERFEVILFTCRETGTALESHCRAHSRDLRVLPADVAGQLAMLRDANLDVVVFGTNVTAVWNEVTGIALHRVAPLQVVNNSSCITSGIPTVDLYVSGSLTEVADAAAHFTERLALLPGPSHAFNYDADRQEATTAWKRSDLGLPDNATVFATAANYYKIIPEMQEAWARLLSAVPNSYLLVHPFNPNWSSSYPIDRFCAEMDRVLAAHGVSHDRLIVSSVKFPSREDVKELLRVADVYLDTFPFGGVNSLIDPLQLGIPPVVWEGNTFRSRMGAALLRELGLTELIASDADAYLGVCQQLAAEPAKREALRQKILDVMDRVPVFLDPLAASDAFGELMLLAFDELASQGREAFRREARPLQAEAVDAETLVSTANYLIDLGMDEEASRQIQRALAAQPAVVSTRHLMAKLLLKRGNAQRACDYLLAAVQAGNAPAPVWRDLAESLRRLGRGQDALSALESSLRIDETDVESWFMLGEVAYQCGHVDILRDVAGIVTRLAPNDPRTAVITAQVPPETTGA